MAITSSPLPTDSGVSHVGRASASHAPARAHSRIQAAGHCAPHANPAPAAGAIGAIAEASSAAHKASGTAGAAARFAGSAAAIVARPKCHQLIGAVASVAAPVTVSAAATT